MNRNSLPLTGTEEAVPKKKGKKKRVLLTITLLSFTETEKRPVKAMRFKLKKYFKSLVLKHGVIKGAFQRNYRSYSLLYLYINLLWVNGVGTVVAKERKHSQ